MKKSFIIFNIITFIIFMVILIFDDNYDINYIFGNNSFLAPVIGKDYSRLLLKIFSLSGLLIQFYFINKKLSEK